MASRASDVASKPTTAICPVFFAAAMASTAPRAIRSLHAKTACNIRVRLKYVLEDVEALVAFQFAVWRGDDLDVGVRLESVAETAQARVARLVTRNAFEHRDPALAIQLLRQKLARDLPRLRSCPSR